MTTSIRRLLFLALMTGSCTAAAAQTVPAHPPLAINPSLLRTVPASFAGQSPTQPARGDSLWNGILLGAAGGAVIGAASSLAIIDCSECAGFNVPVTFGVLGAGAGAGIGAVIDALHGKGAASPQRQPRLRLSPLIGTQSRGMMAWFRF